MNGTVDGVAVGIITAYKLITVGRAKTTNCLLCYLCCCSSSSAGIVEVAYCCCSSSSSGDGIVASLVSAVVAFVVVVVVYVRGGFSVGVVVVCNGIPPCHSHNLKVAARAVGSSSCVPAIIMPLNGARLPVAFASNTAIVSPFPSKVVGLYRTIS